MSNGSTYPGVGGWVQYNVSAQSPLSALPTAAEETIGIVRQKYMAGGKQYLQVVWNPGSATPETGLYTADQLCPLTQKEACDITNQMNSGTFQFPSPTDVRQEAGSNYTQPQVPSQALPAGLQNTSVTPTLTGPITGPLAPGQGYQ